jgi:hypothetical protein
MTNLSLEQVDVSIGQAQYPEHILDENEQRTFDFIDAR